MYSLQNYTTYSICSGISEVEDWVEQADKLGYDALGVSEKQTLSSSIKFQKACKKHDIQPIIGYEALITPDLDVRNKDKKANIQGVLLLYAKNRQGCYDLVEINNYAQEKDKGFYYRPRIDLDFLEKYSENLVCVSPYNQGLGQSDLQYIYDVDQIFEEDFYLSVNPLVEKPSLVEKNKVFKDVGAKKVYTFDCHYPYKSYSHLYDIVRDMDTDRIKKCMPRDVDNAYLPHKDIEVPEYLSSIDDECRSHLNEIKQKCDGTFETGTYYMPEPKPEGESVEDDIERFVVEGFMEKIYPNYNVKKYGKTLEGLYQFKEDLDEAIYPYQHRSKGESKEVLDRIEKYIERLKYEIDIIKGEGYLDYFHIVKEVCDHVDDEGYERGPSRGSAGGSLFSYLLDITKVDPVRHDLIFERFLNPDRNDLPDIDLDFSKDKGDKVVENYIKERWGEDYVCQIGTFDRLKISSGIRKIAMGQDYHIPDNEGEPVKYSYWKLNNILSETDVENSTARGKRELKERLDGSDKFQDFYEKHQTWIEEVVLPLQETIVNKGVHACGWLIKEEPIAENVPFFEHSDGYRVTQWDKKDVEKAGNPKFDFLSIKGINIFEYVQQLAEERFDEKIPRIDEVPLDDEGAIKVFKNANTKGIFQFKQYTQKQYLPKLKPESFNDIVAAVALGRSGPMAVNAHLEYADVKNGKKPVTYPHEDLKPILQETNGVVIYQEQIMKIVKKIGGLTTSETDYVRKAIGKKDHEEMAKWEEKFVQGGIENGYDEQLVKSLWEEIKGHAEYSFNKSHALGYALIAYYQAYLKSRYPNQFWPAILEYSSDDADSDNSAQALKHDVETSGVKIRYPDINYFVESFEPSDDGETIHWPLTRIKGVGKAAAKEMVENGNSFDSLEQFVENTDGRKVNKGVFDALICAGFFDPIGGPYEIANRYYNNVTNRSSGVPYKLNHKNKFKWLKLKNQVYQMPIESWKDHAPFHENVEKWPEERLDKAREDQAVFIGGLVDGFWVKETKYGQWFATLNIVDVGEDITVRIWPDKWEDKRLDMKNNRPWKGQIVEILGRKSSYQGNSQVVVNGDGYIRVVWDEIEMYE